MLKALLFDLDGTLLPLDVDLFTREYFRAVGGYFQSVAQPDYFLQHLISSTEAMVRNCGPDTNETVFMEKFLPMMPLPGPQITELFDRFYQEEFPKLKKFSCQTPWTDKIVAAAREKGYRLVLATNPLFPRVATGLRMEWAGLDGADWETVTTYENSRGCKPNPAYFIDLCRQLALEPGECLMVGNDVQEDLVAGTLGMGTYLVTDCLIDRGQPVYRPDYQGSMGDLHQFICNLPTAEG